MQYCFEYSQIDSWFFKESRPMDAIGNNEMQSIFPPTAYSFSGITRSFLGSQANINWPAYRQGNGKAHSLDNEIDFCEIMGNPALEATDLGSLKFKGCFPSYKEKALLPAPLSLVKIKDNIDSLKVSEEACQTDLGFVRLPELSASMKGAKPLENAWLTQSAFSQVLQGKIPKATDLHSIQDIQTNDPRLGITLSNQTKTAVQGQLYQTSHIRLNADYALQNFLDIDERVIPKQTNEHLVRFGAEGRQAFVNITRESLHIPAPAPDKNTKGLIVYFLTHANFSSQLYPKGFSKTKNNQNQDIWKGILNGIEVTIESAVIGKAVREGGWDLAKHQPKPAIQLIPAGSCWFITSDQPLENVIKALHMQNIGQEAQLGRGLIACGLWK